MSTAKLFESVINDPTPELEFRHPGGALVFSYPHDWRFDETEPGLFRFSIPTGSYRGVFWVALHDLKSQEDLTEESLPSTFAHVASSIFDPTYQGEIPVNSMKNGNLFIRYEELLSENAPKPPKGKGKPPEKMKSVHFLVAAAASPRRMLVADFEFWHKPEEERDLRVQRGMIRAELIAAGAGLAREGGANPSA